MIAVQWLPPKSQNDIAFNMQEINNRKIKTSTIFTIVRSREYIYKTGRDRRNRLWHKQRHLNKHNQQNNSGLFSCADIIILRIFSDRSSSAHLNEIAMHLSNHYKLHTSPQNLLVNLRGFRSLTIPRFRIPATCSFFEKD